MHSVAQSVKSRGGIAATHELHHDGHGRGALAIAVRAGEVLRVRQGWYASRGIHPLIIEALRVGGVATCVTGLELHGCWTIPTSDLHVAVGDHSSRLRSRHDKRVRLVDLARTGVVAHWVDAEDRVLRLPLDCLRDALMCQPPDIVTALADSLLHRMPRLKQEWPAFVESAAAAHRTWLVHVDGVCESGTESLFWFRMRRHRLPITRQDRIRGVGRVDFLIGGWLVVEVDGAAYHTSPEQFEADRHRDAMLSIRGYRVLRFSYRQVVENWAEVEAAVLAAVVRGDHR